MCIRDREARALRVHHMAARGLEHGLAGRGVPFHGRAEARIDVRVAARDLEEFNRGARARPLGNAEAFEEFLGLGIEMGQAHERCQGIGIGPPRMEPLLLERAKIGAFCIRRHRRLNGHPVGRRYGEKRPCRRKNGLVFAPARSLLAVTTADGVAIEATMAPNAKGADLGALEQKRLHARRANPDALTALVSLSHLDPETEKFLEGFSIAERSSAGSSVKFLEIARGNADVYPRFGPTMEWDTADGQAVLEAAGGHVVDAQGARFRYGKTQDGLRNPSFVAWGRSVLTPP